MRILALTNLYPNPWQPGRAPFNRQQLRALSARHSLRVIAPIAWTDEMAARWKGAAPLPSGRQTVSDGIEVDHPRYLFPPKILRSSYGHCFRSSVRRSFRRACDEFHPDLVYASWAYPDGWAAVELGHRAGLPTVVRVHGSDITLIDKHRGRTRGTCEALRQADAVIAPSEDLARRVVELGANSGRTHVVYNGVDGTLFHPGSRSDARHRLGLPLDAPVVLFVGNLVSVKNIAVLIEACARLAAEKVGFACRIIGQGPLAPRLQRQICSGGLSDSVKLLGAKSHSELPDWYRAANVVAIPSSAEGMPNVLLEAVACGTRVVASRVGGIPEFIKESNGRLVAPGDAQGLAQALYDELTQSGGRDSAPLNRPRSFDDSAGELGIILERVLEEHRRSGQSAMASKAILSIESK